MTFRLHTPLIAVAALLALGPSLAMAATQTLPQREDQAQLNADLASLALERAQLSTDSHTLKADRADGKMAAESPDAMRVYHDRQDIRGDNSDLRADPTRSLQARDDRMQRRDDEAQLKTDEHRLRHDRQRWRMPGSYPLANWRSFAGSGGRRPSKRSQAAK